MTLIHPQANVDYSPYVVMYDGRFKDLDLQNDYLLDLLNERLRFSRSRVGVDSNYFTVFKEELANARLTDSGMRAACDYIENVKRKIIAENGCDSTVSVCIQPDKKGRKFIHDYFANAGMADTIQGLINKTMHASYKLIERSVQRQLKDYIDNFVWCGLLIERPKNLFETNKTGGSARPAFDSGWCRKLMKDCTPQSSVTLLSLLQYNMRASERVFLKEFYERTFGCELGDRVGCVAVPATPFNLKNGKVKCDILLFAPNDWRDVISFQADEGKIELKRYNYNSCLGLWSGRARAIGLHTIHGTDTLIRNGEQRIGHWSFSYFVAAPGAALELDSMNYIYLGVANPVTISVPGIRIKR